MNNMFKKPIKAINQEMLENIINIFPGNVAWKNTDGFFLGCNNNLLDFFGLKSVNEIIGKTDYDFLPKEQADIITENDRDVIENNKSTSIETIGLGRSGEPRAYLTHRAPLHDEKNKVIGVLAISFDITDQKQAEEKIRKAQKETEETKAYLENIINLMPGNVFWKNADGGFLGCNKNLLDFFGLNSIDKIIGKTDYDFLPKELAQNIREIEQKVINTDNSLSVEGKGLGKDGVPRFYLTHNAPLHDKDGKVIGILGISFDITDSKEKEQKLQKAKEEAEITQKIAAEFLAKLNKEVTGQKLHKSRSIEEYAANMRKYLENIITLMPGHVYWLDRNGIFLGGNNNQIESLGVKSKEDYIGRTYENFLEKDHAAEVRQFDNEIMRKDEARTLEEVAIKGGKPYATYLTRKVPLHDEKGEVIGLLGVSIDITERKRLEKELQEAKIREKVQKAKIKTIQGAAASIAHEMRTPLSAIKSVAHGTNQYLDDFIVAYKMAKEAELKVPFVRQDQIEDLEEGLKTLDRESELAQSVINMLLTNIKMLGGGLGKLTICSMAECVTSAINRYTFMPKEQAKLVCWEAKNDFKFNGEPLLINHILFNLLKNALYYIDKTDKGEITIWLEKKKNYNELHFKDTGQGIGKEDLPHIFDHFYSKTPHSTGIGLAFCKMTMENIGGDISCQSVYGEFAEFILRFPKIKTP